ncbi:uncharacterized protein CIMG_13336 [Coccidioides immitis RS]|uniref:Uncharacterized protein n=1 Tax=Coccidioides immitis (strain RS) TaxID=246410 RepID=A0A0D8JUH4_COCIM|nr:uncharacterized protein CIMG_13336 [Coccidioides immitis RS]KJF60942.1 hypothetical protein CIMG_13336 [Coccidioides immitis RS]
MSLTPAQASSATLSPSLMVVALALARNVVVAIPSAPAEFVGAVILQSAWDCPALSPQD